MRKLLAISLASVGPVLLATTVLVAGGDDVDDAARRHDPTTAAPSSTSLPPTTTSTVVAPVVVADQAAGRPVDPSGGASPGPAPSSSPEDVAVAVFDAWLQGDDRDLRELATEGVAGFLAARTPDEPGEWSGPRCEGAAGSTYCAWSQSGVELVVRVGNEAVAAGRDHAVMEAFLSVPAGSVAIWPFTTADQAAAAQAGADQGHQPWLLGPESVATAYAQAELGWPDAQVQPAAQPATYDVTDPATGAHATVVLVQPQRQGPTGIWAVIRAGST